MRCVLCFVNRASPTNAKKKVRIHYVNVILSLMRDTDRQTARRRDRDREKEKSSRKRKKFKGKSMAAVASGNVRTHYTV